MLVPHRFFQWNLKVNLASWKSKVLLNVCVGLEIGSVSAALRLLIRRLWLPCTTRPSFCPGCMFLLHLGPHVVSFLLLLWMRYFSHPVFQFVWVNIIPLRARVVCIHSSWWPFGRVHLLWRVLLWTCVYRLVWLPACGPSGCAPGTGMAGHTAALCWLWGSRNWVPQQPSHFALPPSTYKFQFLHVLTNAGHIFKKWHLGGYWGGISLLFNLAFP